MAYGTMTRHLLCYTCAINVSINMQTITFLTMLFASNREIGRMRLTDMPCTETNVKIVLTVQLANTVAIETAIDHALLTVMIAVTAVEAAVETGDHAHLHHLSLQSRLRSRESPPRLRDPAVRNLSLWVVRTSTLMDIGMTLQSTLPCRTSLQIPRSKIACKCNPYMTTWSNKLISSMTCTIAACKA